MNTIITIIIISSIIAFVAIIVKTIKEEKKATENYVACKVSKLERCLGFRSKDRSLVLFTKELAKVPSALICIVQGQIDQRRMEGIISSWTRSEMEHARLDALEEKRMADMEAFKAEQVAIRKAALADHLKSIRIIGQNIEAELSKKEAMWNSPSVLFR